MSEPDDAQEDPNPIRHGVELRLADPLTVGDRDLENRPAGAMPLQEQFGLDAKVVGNEIEFLSSLDLHAPETTAHIQDSGAAELAGHKIQEGVPDPVDQVSGVSGWTRGRLSNADHEVATGVQQLQRRKNRSAGVRCVGIEHDGVLDLLLREPIERLADGSPLSSALLMKNRYTPGRRHFERPVGGPSVDDQGSHAPPGASQSVEGDVLESLREPRFLV